MKIHLARIYERNRQGLFTLSLSITGCSQLAEDAIHEAFVSICRRDSLGENPEAYVFRAVRNAAIDLIRKKRRESSAAESIFNGYTSHGPEDFHQPILRLEQEEILRDAIDDLEQIDREIVMLRAFANLSYQQVGLILDMPLKTVATRYRRALVKLESQLRGKIDA